MKRKSNLQGYLRLLVVLAEMKYQEEKQKELKQK